MNKHGKEHRRLFSERLHEDLKNPKFRKAYEEEELPVRLAIEIAKLREKKGITQVDLAKKLGTKQQVISRIEKLEETNLTIGMLQKIAKALDARLLVQFR